MAGSRLEILIEAGGFDVAPGGRVVLFNPGADVDLSPLDGFAVSAVQPFYPDHTALLARGVDVTAELAGRYDAAVVFLPRSKGQAQNLMAAARGVTAGPIVVDGLKTDGVEPMMRALRKRANVGDAVIKAHGKCFVVTGGVFEDWTATVSELPDGFVTRAGVFSADKIDEGSRLLAEALPEKLPRNVVDLGAGWGFLARAILSRDTVERLDLVEAQYTALDCARQNVRDARAHFHWADATGFVPDVPVGGLVMNPPFHTGRKGEPGLGQAFIAAAADILGKRGTLWMVANRHLPYEAEISRHFHEFTEIGGDNRFKILRAEKPRRRTG